MVKLIFHLLITRLICGLRAEVEHRKNETVVLIHGLGRSAFSMLLPGLFLRKNGYDVCFYTYQSTRYSINGHSEKLKSFIEDVLKKDGEVKKIHFVAHSLGGIIARLALADFASPRIGRMVMIAPPNQGSDKAGRISRIWGASKILVPLDELKNERGARIKEIPVPKMEIGIIAGSKDGKVKVEETHLSSEQDHLIVNSRHTFIMNNIRTKKAVLSFLEKGKFEQLSQL